MLGKGKAIIWLSEIKIGCPSEWAAQLVSFIRCSIDTNVHFLCSPAISEEIAEGNLEMRAWVCHERLKNRSVIYNSK